MKKQTWKKTLRYIVLLLFILILCFFICEFCLRILLPFYNLPLRAVIEKEAFQAAQSSLRVAKGTQIILQKNDFKKSVDVSKSSYSFCLLKLFYKILRKDSFPFK